MSNSDRPDIIESKRLEKSYDLESTSFEDARWLFYDFINDILIKKNVFRELGASPETISQAEYYNKQLKKYLLGEISAEAINEEGIKSWTIHDKLNGINKHAIRFVMTGLGDENKALFYEYGPSMHFELLMSLANDLGASSVCKALREYIEGYPRMQKYKL
jgi:hypothetical protein